MVNERFKEAVIRFNTSKHEYNNEKSMFKADVIRWMDKKGIPVRVHFYGNSFGVDIKHIMGQESPNKIPLNVLTGFCEEFGCEFEHTRCDGNRYIFSFDGMNLLDWEEL